MFAATGAVLVVVDFDVATAVATRHAAAVAVAQADGASDGCGDGAAAFDGGAFGSEIADAGGGAECGGYAIDEFARAGAGSSSLRGRHVMLAEQHTRMALKLAHRAT
ncbi:MAG TPA: hypothetical protein VFB62_27215 [Polyangiaceae bacterium]|nr:hypothetical protein [Polyangiaceae bacterium]